MNCGHFEYLQEIDEELKEDEPFVTRTQKMLASDYCTAAGPVGSPYHALWYALLSHNA